MTEIAVGRAIARAFGEDKLDDIPSYTEMLANAEVEDMADTYASFVDRFGMYADPEMKFGKDEVEVEETE